MQQTALSTIKDYGFFIKGVSGNYVMLDRTWYQEAKPDGNGNWTKSMRTMSGYELSTTIITYKKKPGNEDQFKDAVMVTVFVQSLTIDNVMIPITWVDEKGNSASAPTGLEHIKEANGASGVVTYAAVTPLNWFMAFGLNYVKFAGRKDWKTRVTKNILPYFQGFGKMKGCVIVDDRTDIGKVYDGISVDPSKYPTTVPNFAPHSGALNGIKYSG
jgi:hypothetical protein